MTAARPLDVRFIEYMPFDGNRWEEQKIVPYAELLAELKGAHPEVERRGDARPRRGAARGEAVPGAAGTVSFIASMTQPFCAGCNRLRLTADGSLKVCLFGDSEVSLRDALRGGASDAQLMDLVSMALGRKHAQHAGAPAAPSPPRPPPPRPPPPRARRRRPTADRRRRARRRHERDRRHRFDLQPTDDDDRRLSEVVEKAVAVEGGRRPLDGLPVAALLGDLLPSLAPPPPPPRAAARRPPPASRHGPSSGRSRPSAAPSPRRRRRRRR